MSLVEVDALNEVHGFADANAVIERVMRAVWQPKQRLDVHEWAAAHRVLAGSAASEPGPWRNERTPYLLEIMQRLSASDATEDVVFWAGTQVGKSESGNNWIGYIIDHAPAPTMLVQPTLDTAKRYAKQRIAPMIASTKVLSDRVASNKSRDGSNTMLVKEFDGGVLIITGANSAAGLRSMPARNLFFDEVDAYPLDVDAEGDPISLAVNRQDTYGRRAKRFYTSTCTVKGESRIEDLYMGSSQARYHVPCPHCAAMQVLDWAQIKWVNNDPSTAQYLCAFCDCYIAEHFKTQMLATGDWVHMYPDVARKGYHINSLYSPLGWASWRKIVQEFLEAKALSDKADSSKLQVWTNTRLAQTWSLQGRGVEPDLLQKRSEPYALCSIPRGCLLLTASVDVQGDRIEYMLHGWGDGEEYWALDYQVIYGNPAQDEVWDTLDGLLKTVYKNTFGMGLRVASCAIDSGGHHTHEVYNFTRARQGRHVIAVKGASQSNKPVISRATDVDVNYRNQRLAKGAKVWMVGSDTAKGLLYARITIDTVGAGYIHTSSELPDAWFKGLTAETMVTRYVKGRPRSHWECKKGERNEPLDLWVYGYVAAQHLGMSRWTPDQWQRLRDQVEPALFDPELGRTPSKEVVKNNPPAQIVQAPTKRENPYTPSGWKL